MFCFSNADTLHYAIAGCWNKLTVGITDDKLQLHLNQTLLSVLDVNATRSESKYMMLYDDYTDKHSTPSSPSLETNGKLSQLQGSSHNEYYCNKSCATSKVFLIIENPILQSQLLMIKLSCAKFDVIQIQIRLNNIFPQISFGTTT